MDINPSEITKILKEQIKNLGDKAEVSEIGKVLSVGDGISSWWNGCVSGQFKRYGS